MDCTRFTGEYRLEPTAEEHKARRERLASCHELKGKIAEYKAALWYPKNGNSITPVVAPMLVFDAIDNAIG